MAIQSEHAALDCFALRAMTKQGAGKGEQVMRFKTVLAAASLPIALLSVPVAAKVVDQSEAGFTVAHTAQVAASPADVWKMLRMPESWWSKDHSWSGDAANFYLDPQAGGCFCEKLPPGKEGEPRGSVQHAMVLFARPGAMLRLSGALGPMQGEAMTGTLTITLKAAEGGGTLIRFDYVAGGYARFPLGDLAPQVDMVIGEQLAHLAALFTAS